MKLKTTASISFNFQNNSQGVYDQINGCFNNQNQQQRSVQEAREILGESADSLGDEELYELVTEMQFLVDVWVENYEKSVFDGKTLKELLQLK